MTGHLRSLILVIVSFAMGAAVMRAYDSRNSAETAAARTASDTATALKPADVKPIDFAQEPLWAYGFDRPPQPGDKAQPQNPPSRNLRPNEDPEDQTRLRKLAGSKASYSLVDVRDGSNVIDWFPGDHPPMPQVIARGPAGGTGNTKRGCGSCHLPNGRGRPENAPVAGLPVSYFMRQIQDFRDGKRRSADPRKPNTNTMIDLAKALTDEELKAAAEYFSAIRWTPWIRIVETDLVPKTRIVGNLFLPLEEARTEPIAGRIIETPENEEHAELYRSPRSGFVAYVPTGSVEKGKDLVTTGGARIVGNAFIPGKSTPCITCHGLDLMGVAEVPPIAGRSPSYMVRQMWDMQQRTRHSEGAQLMKLAITNLTPDDLVSVAAYVASRPAVRASGN